MKGWLGDRFQMRDKMVALLIRFLEQDKGTISKRLQEKELAGLMEEEIREIEESYRHYFGIQKLATAKHNSAGYPNPLLSR